MEADWEIIADDTHAEVAVMGNVFFKTTFEIETRRSPRIQVEQDDEALETLINTGIDPAIAYHDSLVMNEEGTPKVYLGWEDVVSHRGVKFKVIPFEDGIVLPATIRDPEQAYGMGERVMILGKDLKKGVKEGKYIKEAVDELLSRSPSEQPIDRYEKLDVQGIMPTGGAYDVIGRDPMYNEYLCYELAYQMDANNDDEMEWVWVTLEYKTGLVIRCQYLPYEHGQNPYRLFRYYTRPGELFGMGIAEKLATYQDGATAVLNQLVDHNDLILALHGNFWYDGTSGFNPDKFVAMLGRPLKVDSIDGVKPFDIQPLAPETLNIYQLFKDIGDLLTATSNPSLGKATDTQKTLGEVQIVAAASSMLFEEVASRVAREWAKVWDQVRWLEAQYADNGEVEYRRTAAPNGIDFAKISREMLLQDVDLVPAGLKQLSDMQSRVQQATITQNTILQHPLMQLIGPEASTEIMIVMLDTFLQAVSYPQKDKIMLMIRQAVAAMLQVQQLEMMQAAQTGQVPGTPPGVAAPEAAQMPVPPGPPQVGVV